MFIVSVFGGLASQMDQYSFMLTLRHFYPNVEIKMDCFMTMAVEHNGYELDKVFGIDCKPASKKEVARLSEVDLKNFNFVEEVVFKVARKLRYKFRLIKEGWIFKPDPSEYYPDYFTLTSNKNYFFFGNFGHPKYKENIEKEILNAFQFKIPLDDRNLKIVKRMENENSVSVHIRHGDYKSSKYNFPVVGKQYYQNAIDYIKKEVVSPVFYFFSDDIDYVVNNFNDVENKVIVDWNKKENSYKDMQLMSCCKHNIIANSGFSFWGAWLNQNPDKIVINPDRHVDSCKNPITYPGWISLDAHMDEDDEN